VFLVDCGEDLWVLQVVVHVHEQLVEELELYFLVAEVLEGVVPGDLHQRRKK